MADARARALYRAAAKALARIPLDAAVWQSSSLQTQLLHGILARDDLSCQLPKY